MLKTTTKLSFTFLLAILLSSAIFSQSFQDYQLHFKNQVISPHENIDAFVKSFSVSAQNVFDNQFYKIIQFGKIPTKTEREYLSNSGITLLGYIPHFGYFACFNTNFNADALSTGSIRSIINITPAIKLAPMLFAENYPDYALREDGKIELLVTYFQKSNPDLVVASLSESGFEITKHEAYGNYLHLISDLDKIPQIANQPFVSYVEPIYPVPEPENYTGRTLHRSNTIANDFLTGRKYDGTGVSVMLQDDGKIGPHIDFQGRIMEQFPAYFGGDHGDHCAGIIGSAGNLDPHARGNAFGAELYVYGAAPEYPGFTSIPSHYFTKNIRVTSTSYSNGCNAGYTTLARSLDMQIINYHALMHVFSAGNDGGSNCGYGAGAGWGNITGGHKVGKNVITVANLNYFDQLANSSSRGPAHDGRIKPDISAKGSSVYSTLPNNDYGNKSGTSMSCPGVAGVVTQLYHAYRDLNDGNDPYGGFIKGVMLNTAEDLGNPGPDFKFGWGRINALRAVQMLEQGRYDSAVIENGETITHQFEVPENTAQMRVMIYWTDYQGTINSEWALVNNLNITVTDPESEEWLPWVLNHFPDADSLDMPAVRGYDERNNMEQVTIDFPEPGNYTISVNGATVPEGPQKYYVYYEFIPEGVVLTYPFGGESFAPGAQEYLRWDAFGNTEAFSLEYSINNGETWILINDNINGDARYFGWTVPGAITGQALVRVTQGNSVSQNPEPFSIMQTPINFNIDWACDEALHLSWAEVIGATSYTVYQLGEKYMDSIATTSVNSFIVQDVNSSETHWFSVSANGPYDAGSMRTEAIEKIPGTFDCFEVDAWMMNAPSVNWGLFQACMNIQSLNITVEVKNFGLELITNPELSYQLDEGAVITETYSGSIQPDSIISFTFSDPIDVSDIGTYSLKTFVEYGPDQNPDNDMLETIIEVIEGASFTPGNIQTIENFEECTAAPVCELVVCELGEDWINLTNEVTDDIDWRPYSGSTNSINTGPSTDHTTGTSSGQYLYLEASVACFNKTAILSLPCIDLTNAVSPALDLWYHAYGAEIGIFHVDLFNGSDIIHDITEPISGNQGNEWKNLTVDLSNYTGMSVGIRFRGVTGGGEKGDFAIDDISITDVTAIGQNDVHTEKINLYPNPANGYVNVSLQNAGDLVYNLKVSDIFGRAVYIAPVNPANNVVNKVIDLSGLTPGIYFIEMNAEDRSYQSKLTIR